jgi:two-component system, NtrC family, nitrogen regulation sensor histidine kinase NtrY
MKGYSNRAHPSTGSLIAVTLIYALLIVLILLFARQLLLEISKGTLLSRYIFIPLAVILPIFLVVTIGYNILRLIAEKRAGRLGIRFKIRLILFFTFITVLSSLPQGILSISFLRTAMESWFSTRITEALQGGLDIAMEYNNESTSSLETFTGSLVFGTIVRSAADSPEAMWRTLKSTYPLSDAVELYDKRGRRFFAAGEEEAFFGSRFTDGGSGLLPRTQKRDMSIIRGARRVDTPDGEVTAILSVVFPAGFDRKAMELTSALRSFRQYRDFQSAFLPAVIAFYSLFSLPLLLLSVLVGFHLSEEVIRPIVHLENAMQRVMSGDYSFRILSRAGDELSLLVRSFNDMVSELEQSRTHLRQTEKVTAWQEIAQRMAHEIKNPLTPIRLSAERIHRAYDAGSPKLEKIIDSSVNSIITEIGKLNQLLAEFRDFARVPTPAFKTSDIRKLLLQAVEPYRRSLPEIDIDTEGLGSIEVSVDTDQMQRALSNLIHNSVDAVGKKGRIYLRCDLVRKGHSHYCRVQIEDTGGGIPADIEDKVFHPYFTTKSEGTGLGLPIVERTIADHHGQIWFESQEGVGTTFFIDIPVERSS